MLLLAELNKLDFVPKFRIYERLAKRRALWLVERLAEDSINDPNNFDITFNKYFQTLMNRDVLLFIGMAATYASYSSLSDPEIFIPVCSPYL